MILSLALQRVMFIEMVFRRADCSAGLVAIYDCRIGHLVSHDIRAVSHKL
jgi:hypothetical protein